MWTRAVGKILICISVLSVALSVKMGILLYLPALLVVDFKRNGLGTTIVHLVTIVTIQEFLATPFLREDAWAYLRSAFDLGRVFLYKWTVNWRILDEETFLSSRTATTLLVGHATALIAFGLVKWCRNDGGVLNVVRRGVMRPFSPAGPAVVTADCKFWKAFNFDRTMLIIHRCRHYILHRKSNWYFVCTLIALPVLFVVRSADSLPCMEDSVSPPRKVSVFLSFTSTKS